MKRMTWASIAIAASAGLVLAGCGAPASGSGSTETQTVTVVDGGGAYHDAMAKAVYEPFEKETGIKVVSQSYDYSQGAIKAQVQGAKQWDVVSTSTALADNAAADLYQPIDYTVVDKNGFSEADASKYFLWSVYSANVLAWNTESIKTAPTSWADLWDTAKFPGPRGLWNSPQSVLEIALLADGVSWDKMYPLDVDRAFKKLDELKAKTNIVWYDSGAQQTQNFSSGTSVIGEGWNGRIASSRKQGQPVDYTIKGALSGGTAWAVLKTAPNQENAMKFMNYAASAQAGAALAEAFPGMSPANDKAYPMIPENIAKNLESNPANKDVVAGNMDAQWWAANYDAVYDRWQKWYSAK
ncbi:ABC transporter substrate-binding protein [Arthrobacter sp. I2-34]|uniref:ABC transporter substrate-binding protein n=1 Tax=Arthrobacter hankyongi TaxID=2904801 RepID=A0ABS9L8M8_9MICC|nr:ABC transporter substrate-binding protein [Arthrobacter hankyongi]MCG2623020.1 ABC transporter substrate-binding protein [Arthrobacter hankyongi]